MKEPMLAPPLALRERLEQLVGELGEREAARQLELNPATLIRIIAGRPVQKGTIAQCALKIGGGQ